jgi:hypothetical protein
MPIRSRLLPLAVAAALLVSCAVGTAAAVAGELTTFEYQQLIATRAKLKTAKGMSAAIWDCEQIQMQTPLLTAERSDCTSQFQIGNFANQIRSYAKDCVAYPSASARLNCLLPAYAQFDKAEETYYHAESKIHQIATSRGLGEACADLLSDTPVVISEEQLAVNEIGELIRDIRAGDVAGFESVSRKTAVVLDAVQKGQQTNDGSPSICPHPGAHNSGNGDSSE